MKMKRKSSKEVFSKKYLQSLLLKDFKYQGSVLHGKPDKKLELTAEERRIFNKFDLEVNPMFSGWRTRKKMRDRLIEFDNIKD